MLRFRGNKARFYRFILRFKNLKDKTGCFIGSGSKIVNGTIIGDGTRINGSIVIKGSGCFTIGKYGALGDQIKIITSNHRMDIINLQYGLSRKLGLKSKKASKENVLVGNNVWIGDNSLIVPGVEIGNGAIVGAGSVVTKNVPAYAVVAGAPAKFIRHRFEADKIAEIEALQWWDWSLEKLKVHKELLH